MNSTELLNTHWSTTRTRNGEDETTVGTELHRKLRQASRPVAAVSHSVRQRLPLIRCSPGVAKGFPTHTARGAGL